MHKNGALLGISLSLAGIAAALYSSSSAGAQTVDSGTSDVTGASYGGGIANNNPLNMRYITPPNNFNGQIADVAGYGRYDTWQNGMRAAGLQLTQYYNKGLQTPAAIIATWAPASDGNDVLAYITDVCSRMNVVANARLSWPYDQLELVMAMCWHENGSNPYDLTDVQTALNS